MKVRCISLDVDGTLYRVRRLRLLWRMRAERGLLVAWAAAREKLRAEGVFESRDALLDREAELVAPSFGLASSEARVRLEALRAALPDALTAGATPHRGLKSALDAALASGLKLAILSDHAAAVKLRNLGLDRVPFATVVCAEDEGALKPHGRCFLRLCERLDMEPPEIVHVGDREELDVEGALSVGMRAWRYSPEGAQGSRAERVFDRWALGSFQPLVGR